MVEFTLKLKAWIIKISESCYLYIMQGANLREVAEAIWFWAVLLFFLCLFAGILYCVFIGIKYRHH